MYVSAVDTPSSGEYTNLAEEFVEHLKRENRELREEVEVLKAALDLAKERAAIQEPPNFEPVKKRPSMYRLRMRLEAESKERARNGKRT